MTAAQLSIPRLATVGHSSHSNRCLTGLPFSEVMLDSFKVPLIFYCLGILDILNTLESKTTEKEREGWRELMWGLYVSGHYGAGFRPSFYMMSADEGIENPTEHPSDFDAPHMIATYTAILCLAILKDDFGRLDRPGLLKFLRSCQREDGSFGTDPTGGDMDLRLTYCAFVVSSLLDEWSGVDVDKAIEFVRRCRTYEGGYGQAPGCEAQGGPTYLAIATLQLAPGAPSSEASWRLTPTERRQTLRWLFQNQDPSGGFRGRTNKEADACYCFWCAAAIEILGESSLVDSVALASFMGQCQFKYGGMGKAPGERADPYHTYLSLAALCVIPPPLQVTGDTWKLEQLDSVINAKKTTVRWAKEHIGSR